MNGFKWNWTTLLILGIVLAFVGSAQAAEVEDFAVIDGETLNDADDVDYEWLVKGVNPDTGGLNGASGVIQKGDFIRGVFGIDQLNGTNLTSEGVQWAGIFSLKVVDIVNKSDQIGGAGDGSGNDTGDIIFGADPGFFNTADTTSLLYFDTDSGTAGTQLPDGPNLGANSQVLARMWQLNSGASIGASLQSSRLATMIDFSRGEFFWDLGYSDPSEASHAGAGGTNGIVSDNGEGWVARADTDFDGTIESEEVGNLLFGAVAGVSPADLIGRGEFSLSVINNGVWTLPLVLQSLSTTKQQWLGAASDAMGYVLGFSTVEGGDSIVKSSGFDAKSSSNFTFLALPLPAAAWPGLGLLLALGAFRLRRRNNEE